MSAHEDIAAELHAQIQKEVVDEKHHTDLAGGDIGPIAEKSESNGSMTAKEVHDIQVALGDTPDGEEPNEHEISTLRRVGENLPASAFLVAAVEFCERFTYYGASGLFQNYISNSPEAPDVDKGLGLGHQGATGLNTFFQFFCYITPILGAIIADQYLGRYKTIVLFAMVYVVGLLILWVTALPGPFANGAGLGGYVTALIVIGFGTGGIKSNVAPLIADQYQRKSMAVKTEKSGERVIIDPAITYQRIYMIFYGCINIGSLSLLATPFMERDIGFWSAYLLCFCMFIVAVTVLILGRKQYVVRPPQGSIITDALKAIGMMIASRDMDAPKPSWRAARNRNVPTNWNDHFIEELKRALRACKVFAFYPIFWICYGQFSTNFVSQAAQMNGHGMPNDEMQNFDPIAILVFLPILDLLVYPAMRKAGIPLKPIMRITIGFFFAALCLAYAAIVQHLIYNAGPCYDAPLACPGAGDPNDPTPNDVHIAIQTPAYVFIGLSEIFLNVTGLEYAYMKAPPSMKSFVQSLYLFTSAFGSALSEALVPATTDPAILWMYTGVAIAAAITGIIFWLLFHHYDAQEDEMNALDKDDEVLRRPSQAA